MLTIGTRGSALALKQTAMVVEALERAHPHLDLVTEVLSTSGDQKQGTVAANVGDKRDWIQGLEESIVSGQIDCAVHSAKDVPIDIHPETVLMSVLPRGFPGDVLVIGSEIQVDDLKPGILALQQGATLGTASVRRRAQIKRLRPDLNVVNVRGNVPTRIAKLYEGLGLSAVVLAKAGVDRLRLLGLRAIDIPVDQLMPAINQGILAVQMRADRKDLVEIFTTIQDTATDSCFKAERAFIGRLGAGCRSAVGVYAEVVNGELSIRTEVIGAEPALDVIKQEMITPVGGAIDTGKELADAAFSEGAAELLASWSS
jgi:hydroxymethylbilane synthase